MSDREHPSPAQLGWDVVLGAVCLGAAVAIHLGGSEAVAGNRDPGVLSVLLTTVAVGPLVARRRFPLAVLSLTLLGLLALVATRNTVGASTLGCIVAFYTAVALGSRRRMSVSLAVMVVGIGTGLLMRPVDLSTEGALVHLLVFTGAGVLGYGVRQRRERFAADVVAARERAALSASEERLRITRELHDIIGHAMSVMVVQAGVAERLLDADPERARAAVAQIGATGRTSLSEMRQVLGALRDGDPDPGTALPRDPAPGLAQLTTLAARVEAAGLPVTLTMHGEVRPLPQGLELAAYRVVQESLTNCLKHAGATRARVTVTHSWEEVRVVVEDDGTSSSQPTASGHGIAGMRERVAFHGGDLSAGPGPAGGFRVEARLPVRVPSQPAPAP